MKSSETTQMSYAKSAVFTLVMANVLSAAYLSLRQDDRAAACDEVRRDPEVSPDTSRQPTPADSAKTGLGTEKRSSAQLGELRGRFKLNGKVNSPLRKYFNLNGLPVEVPRIVINDQRQIRGICVYLDDDDLSQQAPKTEVTVPPPILVPIDPHNTNTTVAQPSQIILLHNIGPDRFFVDFRG